MSNVKKLSLETIANGAIPELFARELAAVLANIHDPNTSAKSARGISIDIKMTPDADRGQMAVSVSVTSKLATTNGAAGIAYLGKDGGRYAAYTADVRQEDIFSSESRLGVVKDVGNA